MLLFENKARIDFQPKSGTPVLGTPGLGTPGLGTPQPQSWCQLPSLDVKSLRQVLSSSLGVKSQHLVLETLNLVTNNLKILLCI